MSSKTFKLFLTYSKSTVQSERQLTHRARLRTACQRGCLPATSSRAIMTQEERRGRKEGRLISLSRLYFMNHPTLLAPENKCNQAFMTHGGAWRKRGVLARRKARRKHKFRGRGIKLFFAPAIKQTPVVLQLIIELRKTCYASSKSKLPLIIATLNIRTRNLHEAL